jgi:hypothetical protein
VNRSGSILDGVFMWMFLIVVVAVLVHACG